MEMSFILEGIRYYYIRKLGIGTRASIFLVHNDGGQEFVAKVSSNLYQASVEINALKKLQQYLNGRQHPNIVYYYGSGLIANSQLPREMRERGQGQGQG